MKRKVVTAVAIVVLALLVYPLYRERHLVYFFKKSPARQEEAKCDDALWEHNAEQETVLSPCISLTGTVLSMHAEDDGDEQIQLRPDADYVRLLNLQNIFREWGNIGVEPICENPPTRKEFKRACRVYKSAIILPRVGDHIKVIGSYTVDKHGWTEIHPVTEITKL